MPAPSILQQGPSPSLNSDSSAVPVLSGGLEGYEIGQAIGKGGYAIVYRGKRKSDGLLVAIKRVDIAEMAPKKRDRCIKEVHLLQQLNHPHIITMYDAFIDQSQLIIITEWAPGGDLKKLIRRMAEAGKRFEEPEIWQCFLQILDGLRGMHAARILHRDMKPANVLVCAAGVLKLGDLGLGRKLGPQTVDVLSKVGTPYYVSPEVVKGVKYDFKSDIWSTGCLLYELAMLKSPFETEGANLYDVFSKISRGDYQPLPADRFSPALRGLVSSLLAQDPVARPTAEQVWQQGQLILQQQAAQQEQRQQPSQVVPPPQEQQQQQRPQSDHIQRAQQQDLQQQLRRQTTSVNRRQQDCSLGDVAVMSEHLASSLLLIAYETAANSRSGNSSRSTSTNTALSPAFLRCLHALFFAQPLAAFGKGAGGHIPQLLQEEQMQQLQMGVAVHVAAWLSRLCKQLDAAQALEAELLPHSSAGSRGSGWGSNLFQPCRDCLKAAEALRRAAQALGVPQLETIAATDLSVGRGRAVCHTLQAMADATIAQLQLACRPSKASAAAHLCMEELVDDEGDAAADIAATAADAAGPDVEDTSANLDQEPFAEMYSNSQQQEGTIQGAGQQRSPVRQAVIQAQVDVVAWHAETERLGPQLTRIHVPAAATDQAGLTQEYLSRWQSTKQLQQQLAELLGQVSSSLPTVQQQVAGDMERLTQTEDRLNRQFASSLSQYTDIRQQLNNSQQQRQESEDAVMMIQQHLHQVSSRMDEVKQQIADRTDQLQGSVILQRQRTAVQSLKAEIQNMEQRLGLLMHQLVKCSIEDRRH